MHLSEPFSSLDDYLAWAEQRPEAEQYEVVDGQPVMSPSPTPRHQLVLARVWATLRDACSPGFEVLPAPLDWVLWERPRLQLRQPDLLVVSRGELDLPRLVGVPLLAVEVLSPTSVERDAVTKLRDYAKAGLEHYWIVDPDTPFVAVYRHRGDQLALVAQARGADLLALTEPFSLELRPVDLLR